MARYGPSLAVPMTRTSGLAVPMTKASAMSMPFTRNSGISIPQSKQSRMRRSSIGGGVQRDTASYMAEIQKAAEAGVKDMDALVTLLAKTDRGGTRLSYTSMNKHTFPKSTDELLHLVEKDAMIGNIAVCVVENISPALIKTLGAAWDLDPAFFAMHASNPPIDRLWRHLSEWKPPASSQLTQSPTYDYLDGIYEFHDMDLSLELMQRSSTNYCHRHMFKDGHWPVNVTTKISYARVSSTLYLFLVDPPVRYEHAIRGEVPERAIPTVRFPYAQNRGGVLLPSPFIGRIFVPFTSLERIFRHAWQLELLFQPEEFFCSVPFLYLMSFSLWYSRLHRLDKEIKRISFNDVRNPDLNVTDTLHNFREEISMLQTTVDNTRYYASHGIHKYYNELWEDFAYPNMLNPLDGHEAISKNSTVLHKFLLETFQLLMTTMTVRDTQISIQQSHETLIQTRQTIILTRLATFFLPWTLTSGIFGMNIKQMNNSGLDIWIFVTVGVLVVGGTILVFQMQAQQWDYKPCLKLLRWRWYRDRYFRKHDPDEP